MKRKRRYKRRGGGRKRRRMGAGTKALKLVKNLQKQVEVKVIDPTAYRAMEVTRTATTNVQTDAQIHNATTNPKQMCIFVAQGDAKNERLGNKITLKSIDSRIKLNLNPATSVSTMCKIQLVLVQDRRPNGTQATWGNVFQLSVLNSHLTSDEEFRGRFQILYNKIFSWEDGVNRPNREVSYFKRFNKQVWFNDTSYNYDDIQRNTFFWMILVHSNNIESATLTYGEIATRIRYTDT